MKAIKITYWITTIILVLMMTMSSIMQITMQPAMVNSFRNLGFPPQLMVLLGILKALGVIALMYPGFKGIKEWAYAGFTFLLVGAAYSHYTIGDLTPAPIILLILLGISYLTFKRADTAKRPVLQTN